MEEDDRLLRGVLEVLLHACKVEADGLFVVVTVLVDLEARVLEDRDVVPPGRCGKVDVLAVGVESLQEGTADTEGTSAGDGLGDGDLWFCETRFDEDRAGERGERSEGGQCLVYREETSQTEGRSHVFLCPICPGSRLLTHSVLFQRRAVLAVGEKGGMFCELREACDGEVLFVVLGLDDALLGLLSL